MMPPEEVLRNVEYVRCPACFGDRVVLRIRCVRCAGMGAVIDPPEFSDRLKMGLAALWGAAILQLASKPKKRLRLPLRKKRRV